MTGSGRLATWAVVIAATLVATAAAAAVGLPTPSLFAALAVGIAWALSPRRVPLELHTSGMTVAQVLIGVALGAELQLSTLTAVGSDWLGVSVVVVATLAVSLAIGMAFAHLAGIGRPTSMLGLVAGGASGIVAMADELGADSRLVAFMQYLRVLFVVLVAPLVAYMLLEGDGDAPALPDVAVASLPEDLAFTIGCAACGMLVASRVRVTAGLLLAPLVVAAVVSISGLSAGASVPGVLEEAAFAIVGLEVGLRFTRATIREAGRLLPWALAAIVGLVAVCAGLAALLVPLAGVSFADAYLATTPGGMYAVLAASIGIGADSTFVVAAQVMRMVVIVVAAPPLVRLASRGRLGPLSD